MMDVFSTFCDVYTNPVYPQEVKGIIKYLQTGSLAELRFKICWFQTCWSPKKNLLGLGKKLCMSCTIDFEVVYWKGIIFLTWKPTKHK